MNLGIFKIRFHNDELVFFDEKDKFIFSISFKGDITKLQEALNDDLKKIKLYFSLFPFGIGIYNLQTNEKIGVILIKIW